MKWRTSYVSPLCAVTLRDVRSIALDRQWTPGMLCATCGCPSISFIMWNVNVPEILRISITSFVSIVRPVKFGNYSFKYLGFPNDPTKEIMFFNLICCHKSLTNNCLTHVFIHCPYHDIKILQNSGDSEQARWSTDLLLLGIWSSPFPCFPAPQSASNNHSEYSKFCSIKGILNIPFQESRNC